MADAPKNPFAATPAKPAPNAPVAGGPSSGQPLAVAAGSNAASLAVANGGLPGGKARADGLKPGSPEAIKADREKERVRKAQQRAKNRTLAIPPPLPSANATPVPARVDQNQPLLQIDGPAMPAQDVALVPWLAADLQGPLTDALELLEEADKTVIEGKLEKAHLSVDSTREVMADAAWPKRAKEGVSKYGSSALAKGLNALGLSATHKDIALIVPSVAYLITDRVKLYRRLDALIKAANAAQPGAAQKP